MSDLIDKFFEEDLTGAEEEALGHEIASSEEAALRMLGKAEEKYIQYGLPDPPIPHAGGMIPTWLVWLAAGLALLGVCLWRAQQQCGPGLQVPSFLGSKSMAPANKTHAPFWTWAPCTSVQAEGIQGSKNEVSTSPAGSKDLAASAERLLAVWRGAGDIRPSSSMREMQEANVTNNAHPGQGNAGMRDPLAVALEQAYACRPYFQSSIPPLTWHGNRPGQGSALPVRSVPAVEPGEQADPSANANVSNKKGVVAGAVAAGGASSNAQAGSAVSSEQVAASSVGPQVAVQSAGPMLSSSERVEIPAGAVRPEQEEEGAENGSLQKLVVKQKDSGPVVVRVLTGDGREVRRLYEGMLDAGDWSFKWDGMLPDGTAAKPGIYQIEISNVRVLKQVETVIPQAGPTPEGR